MRLNTIVSVLKVEELGDVRKIILFGLLKDYHKMISQELVNWKLFIRIRI